MKANNKKNQKETGLEHILKAFQYSLNGLKEAYKNEKAFRLEVVFSVFLVPLALIMPFPLFFKAYLISSHLLVFSLELFNSAIEGLVDHLFKDFNLTAKIVKDLGSAGVMFSLINVFVAWCFSLLSLFER